MSRFAVTKKSTCSRARLGRIATPHGSVRTPFFMPDATRAVVKTLSASDLERLGLPAAVVNTYHLLLAPGEQLVKKFGGVHEFMQWKRPLLSDSGGFQVFSLIHKNPQLGKIHDDKAVFRSPLDGAKHELTPERSIQIQFDLGTDMMVVLDDCPPHELDGRAMARAIEHTTAWAARCKKEYDRQVKRRKLTEETRPLLFGVVQGGLDAALRQEAAAALLAIGFDGYGFGGRPVDSAGNFAADVLAATADAVGENVPRFGLGIGTPADIVRCVQLGWDMFDCVIPTREGRHGRLFMWRGAGDVTKRGFYRTVNITNAKFTTDRAPINAASKLPELREYSKGYLHHLLKTNESLGWRLASLHNLEFYLDVMARIRQAVKAEKL